MACQGGKCKATCGDKHQVAAFAEKIMSAKDITKTIDDLLYVLQKISDYSLLTKLGLDVTAMQDAVESVRRLILENEYLRRIVPSMPAITVVNEPNTVSLSFGPQSQYKLVLPIVQSQDRLLLAKQFREFAAELERPTKPVNNPAQTLLAFSESEPA
jgi:hypothetical protein